MKVTLSNTLGIPNTEGEYTYYGPGVADVPDAYAKALGLPPVAEATDYSAMNAEDFLAAVDAGELSKEDALKLEQAREKPRKGVLDALAKEPEGE